MQVKDKGSSASYHVPDAIGRKLIAAGLAEEVKSKQPEREIPEQKFAVVRGYRTDDSYEHPPKIVCSCKGSQKVVQQGTTTNVGCGFISHVESTAGTAHLATFRHCCAGRAVVARVPENIAVEYRRAFAEWRQKFAPIAKPTISKYSDTSEIYRNGLLTSEEIAKVDRLTSEFGPDMARQLVVAERGR